MVTTNLTNAKHLNGSSVVATDIKVGLVISAPSLTGGVLNYKCVSVTGEGAFFESTNSSWTINFCMRFNQPDIDAEDFIKLSEAINNFGGCSSTEDRLLVTRANELGYATMLSYTQAYWTEKGMAAYKQMTSN